MNLLQNAVDAISESGTITVSTENFMVEDEGPAYAQVARGEYVKLTISDTGCGIASGVVDQIFEPFFTTKTVDRDRGSGLGLSVVSAVVKDHQGYIDLDTQVGEGTQVYLYLPISRELDEAKALGEVVGGTASVLVVDDDEMQRNVSLNLLQRLGYRASAVVSGEEATAFLREHPRDILLLDMIMPPGIDGTETYRRIKKLNPSQRALIVSGYSESERVEEAQKLGAGAFVKKPLTLEGLAAALRKELDRPTGGQTS